MKYNKSFNGKFFADAKTLLEALVKSPDIIRLLDKANAGFSDTEVRYDNSIPNLSNQYPLYNVLTGYSNTYEYYEYPFEVACINAIEDAFPNEYIFDSITSSKWSNSINKPSP